VCIHTGIGWRIGLAVIVAALLFSLYQMCQRDGSELFDVVGEKEQGSSKYKIRMYSSSAR